MHGMRSIPGSDKETIMTASLNPVAEGDPRPRRDLSLWNLHDSLARLAEELAEVARKFDAAAGNEASTPPSIEAMTPREYFSSLLDLRRLRERYFGSELFGEPAWDILLELMLARIDERELRASELTTHGNSPSVVARHYIEVMEQAKLVETLINTGNTEDPYLALSSEAALRMAELYRSRTRG